MSAAAAEIGPVEILSQQCRKAGEQVTCQIQTSTDTRGAKYKLTLTGEAGRMSSLLTLLPLAEENRLFVHLTVKNLVSSEGNLMEGRFEKIVIRPSSD